MACRCLTKEEVIIQGLVTGRDTPLEVREGGCAARGVFATASVTKGQWLCEYKGLVYPYSEREKHLEEYDKNKEGCYIVSSKYPVGDSRRLCWDATRHLNQYGRYMNHAQQPNAHITSPSYVRGKWRVGFVAAKDIEEGDEEVWDYGVRKEAQWGRSRLVKGVVVNVSDESRPCPEEEVRLDIL